MSAQRKAAAEGEGRVRYTLEFEIKGLPRMNNLASKASTHWRYAHREMQKWHQLVWASVGRNKPATPLKSFKLTLTRFSLVSPDYDGLVRGFKHIVDALRVCGVIENDRLENTGPWDCRWVKAPAREGKVQIRVEEVK